MTAKFEKAYKDRIKPNLNKMERYRTSYINDYKRNKNILIAMLLVIFLTISSMLFFGDIGTIFFAKILIFIIILTLYPLTKFIYKLIRIPVDEYRAGLKKIVINSILSANYKEHDYYPNAYISPSEIALSGIFYPYKRYTGEDLIIIKHNGIKASLSEARITSKNIEDFINPNGIKNHLKWIEILIKILIKIATFFIIIAKAILTIICLGFSYASGNSSGSHHESNMDLEAEDITGLFNFSDNTIGDNFKGIFILLEMPKKFKYDLTIFNDVGGEFKNLMYYKNMGSHFMQNKKRVRLEDPVFESMFEVYAEDQIISRVVLDPAFMERLVKFSKNIKSKHKIFSSNFSMSLFDNKCFIRIPCEKNLFELNGLKQSCVNKHSMDRCVKQISIIDDIIDTLKLHLKTEKK